MTYPSKFLSKCYQISVAGKNNFHFQTKKLNKLLINLCMKLNLSFFSISRPTTTISQVNFHKTNKTVQLFHFNYFFCLTAIFTPIKQMVSQWFNC